MKGLLDPASSMRSRGLALWLVTSLLLSAMPVQADTVIRADPVDLLPAGDFENASAWSLSTNKAYVTDVADHTTAMITDGHLSFTHERPRNTAEFTAWAFDSPTGDELATGEPDCFRPATDPVCDNDLDGDSDGGYAWTKGPVIDLEGYDLSSGAAYPLLNVSLVVAFRIPDPLQQDTVRITVQSEGTTHLVKTYAHTPSGVNHMQNNAKHYPLDGFQPWTWYDLANLTVTLDYVSVGEFDDSELQVDAVGLWVRHLQPWGTFEMAKATHSVHFDELPVMGLDLAGGQHTDVALGSCGLERTAPTASWITDPIARPHDQDWGRFHPQVDGNATWTIQTSPDGDAWGDWNAISSGDLLPDVPHLRFHAVLMAGCIEGVKVDLNDPTLTLQGSVAGAAMSMVPAFAKLRVALNGAEVGNVTIASGPFALSVPVGHLLGVGGGPIDVGLSARFHWSSNGSAETVVIDVEDISIDGGFEIEWDRDPICENVADQTFLEDGGGRLLEFRYTCQDDLTDSDALLITAVSADPSLLDAGFVNDQIRLQPQPDASGDTSVTVQAMDGRGNTWSDTFAVHITPVDDAPEMDPLPVSTTVEVGETLSMALGHSDVDSGPAELSVVVTPDWARVSGGMLELTPPMSGTHLVTVTISDATSTISQSMTVIATQRADLWVESILVEHIDGGQGDPAVGDSLVIQVYVRNSGDTLAQAVGIRCTVDGETVGRDEIPMLSPGALETAVCDWSVTEAGDVRLSIEVDWTEEVDETNEANNLWSTDLQVQSKAGSTGTTESEEDLPSTRLLWGGVIIVGLIGLGLLQLGPGRIRRIQ